MPLQRLVLVLSITVLLPLAGPTQAQQVLVDDPTSVAPGAAQLEAWHSPEESWMAAGVRVHPRVEVGVGAAFLATGTADRRTVDYSLESKILLRPGSAHRIGAAVVGGIGVQQLGIPVRRPASRFAYGILSQDLLPGHLTAYQNVGWVKNENGPHLLTWGARLDWQVLDRFVLIGEAYGEGRVPSVQVALRSVLLPDRIEADVSVTRGDVGGAGATWVTLGFTFMSASLY